MNALGVGLGIAALFVVILATFLILRMLVDARQRVIITVMRPTTTDGETVQITANLRASADSPEIAAHLEKASLSIQRRVARQNEIVAETDAKIAHEKWRRIKAKLAEADKMGKRGIGVLSTEERRWWLQHNQDFDDQGPVAATDRVQRAAWGPETEAEAKSS